MSQTTAQHEVATALAEERKSIDVLDQLMKPEVQQSLTVLVDNLPKLAEMVTMMTKAYDFAQGIATDKVLIHEFAHGIGEFVKPVQDKAKGIAQAAIEAGERTQPLRIQRRLAASPVVFAANPSVLIINCARRAAIQVGTGKHEGMANAGRIEKRHQLMR